MHSELEKALHLVFVNKKTLSEDVDDLIMNALLSVGIEEDLLNDAQRTENSNDKERVGGDIEVEVAAAQDAAAKVVADDKQEPQEKTTDVEIATEVQAEVQHAPEDAATESVENHEENSEAGGQKTDEQQEKKPTLKGPSAPPSQMQTHVNYRKSLFDILI